jgi:hypothetical protein
MGDWFTPYSPRFYYFALAIFVIEIGLWVELQSRCEFMLGFRAHNRDCLWVTWQHISSLILGPNERGVDSNMIILLTQSFQCLWVAANHESEKGPGFHGYDKVWFASDVTTRLLLVGGSVCEYWVYCVTWGACLWLRIWFTRRFVWLSGFFCYIT